MNCNTCDKEITKENKRRNYKNICKDCLNKKIAKYNRKRYKELKEASWF